MKKYDDIVEKILRNDTLAREDDCYLILKVIEELHPLDVGKIFSDVMINAKSKGISFEGITRCRRKVQTKYPELQDAETVKARNAEQKEYRKYSKEYRD